MSAAGTGLLVALVVLASVLWMVATKRLTLRYAGLWLLVASGLTLVGLVPGLLARLSVLLGFQVPANLLFSVGLGLLLLIGLHLSVAVTRLEVRTQRLAEEVALLKAERPAAVPGESGEGAA